MPTFQYFSIFARIIFTYNYLSIIYSHLFLSLFRLKGSLWHPEPVLIAIISILLVSILKILSLARHISDGIVLIAGAESLLISFVECF